MSDAVLQIEFDVRRFTETKNFHGFSYAGETENAWNRIYNIAKTAACDTIRNGGTFVLVVSDNKITMVQRSGAVDLDAEEEPKP